MNLHSRGIGHALRMDARHMVTDHLGVCIKGGESCFLPGPVGKKIPGAVGKKTVLLFPTGLCKMPVQHCTSMPDPVI